MSKLITVKEGISHPKNSYTKKEVAKLLGVHHNTVTKYETVAYLCIDHYERASQTNRLGQWHRNAPMTLYQVWVIYWVKQLFDVIPHGYNRIDLVSERLLKDEKTSEVFSPNTFSKDLPSFLAKINLQTV